MNPVTNNLATEVYLSTLEESQRRDYVSIPERLQRAAWRKLGGQQQAQVSKHSGGQLSRWAAEQRKAKRKAEKASRKRNRA
jgi:hypothetical protein